MANVFKPKRSSTASSVPTTSNLADGELAVNSADQKIYLRDGNSIVEVANASGGSSGISSVAEDTTPQLGGNLDVNGKNITFGDSAASTDDRLTFGAGTDLSIYHTGSSSNFIDSGIGAGGLKIRATVGNIEFKLKNLSEDALKLIEDGAVELYYDSAKKLETSSTGVTVTGNIAADSLVVDGSIDSGATDYAGYRSDGTNIVLKGDASGRSAIFFQSEKNGTNINHPSDYAYIQYHPYGIDGTTGEANKLVIGVANDSDDTVVLQSPYKNGVKISFKDATSGTGGSEYTIWHAGNDGASSGLDADLLDGQQGSYYLDYNNFTNTPSIPTNNNQLTNGAGYLTTTDKGSGGYTIYGSTFSSDHNLRIGNTSTSGLNYINSYYGPLKLDIVGYDGSEYIDIRTLNRTCLRATASGATYPYSIQLYSNESLKLQTVPAGIEVVGTTDTDQLIVSGIATISSLTYPSSDGTNGQVLTTNGSGTLSFTTVSGGGGISNIVEDTTPQLGGTLDLNSKTINHDGSGLGGTYGDITFTPTNATYNTIAGGMQIRVRNVTSNTWSTHTLLGPDVTIAGSVTANSFVKSGGTSSQYLMADGSVSTGGGGGGGSSALTTLAFLNS